MPPSPARPHARHSVGPLRSRLAQAIVLAFAAGAPVPATVWADVGPDARAASLQAARERAGADPHEALRQLQALRAALTPEARSTLGLAVDEASCRVQADLDPVGALAIAGAGLSGAGEPPPAARGAWLRLRACRAGALVDLGRVDEGHAELEALLALPDTEALAAARAIARLERGVARSRNGDFAGGQEDLLAACGTLARAGDAIDRSLCLGHLANHYRRVGDTEEALRLLTELREDAARRGAIYDDSIYTYAMAQVHEAREDWPAARDHYLASAALCARLGDDGGLSYAENGVANALLATGDAAGALPHARRSLALLEDDHDPKQRERTMLTLADALLTLGQTAEAQAALDRTGATVRQREEAPTLVRWWSLQARAAAQRGRWREAYEAESTARSLDARLQQRRLSEQSARLRMQYNRERDAQSLATLRRLNDQGQRLRHVQAIAIGLTAVLLVLAASFSVRKVRQTRRLQRLASTDELTGLPNRRATLARLDDTLARARRHGRGLAVAMLDVDHFKHINDRHGHAAGDEVLRRLARVLPTMLRDGDCLGRLGGEEFIAVLAGAGEAEARRVAERMRSAIAQATSATAGERNEAGSALPECTGSIGVAAWQPGESAAALVARADAALYRAKHAGRNRVVLDAPSAQTAPALPAA